MDVSQYLEIFIDETKEHLQSLNEQLLVIEKEPENTDTINEIFRAAHSLKGMAGTMGYKRMQKLTHQMENVFSEIRNGAKKVDANIVDVLFQCLDALEEYLACIQETADEGDNDNEPILKQLETILNGSAPKAQTEASKETAKEPQKAEAEEAKEKYKDFVYADFEKHAIAEAFEKGINVYTITVFVDENCLLKAARAFLVFKSVEGVGEIIKSNPSAQDIEDEKFEFDFSICVVSKEPLEAVLSVIKNVSEIADAIGEKLESVPGDGKTEEGKPAGRGRKETGGSCSCQSSSGKITDFKTDCEPFRQSGY